MELWAVADDRSVLREGLREEVHVHAARRDVEVPVAVLVIRNGLRKVQLMEQVAESTVELSRMDPVILMLLVC